MGRRTPEQLARERVYDRARRAAMSEAEREEVREYDRLRWALRPDDQVERKRAYDRARQARLRQARLLGRSSP